MTIHRVKGVVAFSCDGCPDTFDSEMADHAEAWAAARTEGWVCLEVEEEFLHHCQGCARRFGTA